MARTFSGDGGTDKIDLGDVSGAAFEHNVAWTFLAFVRITAGQASEQHCVCGKVNSGSTRQFLCRVDAGTGFPRDLEIYTWNGFAYSLRINLSGTIEQNAWHLVAVSNNGAFTGYVIDADGTVNSGTGTHNSSVSGGVVTFGRTGENSDELNGDIAFASYVHQELSQDEILNYLVNPYRVLSQYGVYDASGNAGGCVFFLPMFGNQSPEPDWSGLGNSGTVTGTTQSDGPPVVPYRRGYSFPSIAASAAAAGGFPFRRNPMRAQLVR